MMETNWIRFDPDDKLTWPEMESERYSKTVLAYSDGRIHLAHMVHLTNDEFEWFLTNEAEDVTAPIDCVTAWMPLPEPFYATLCNRLMNPYLRETHESQRGT